MKQELSYINIINFRTSKGVTVPVIPLSFEVFGKPLHTAPIVLVNHALTGNSTVCGNQGWWKNLIGTDKSIDTNIYTILSFNVPGNGYDQKEENLIDDYRLFTARDIAQLFKQGLEKLNIKKLYAAIGGSIGGGIAWELAVLAPEIIKHLIPIASDWKATDWLKANCLVQNQILENSSNPIHDARLHAMLIYRTPASFKQKFDLSYNNEIGMYNVESWLLHHGKKLDQRFKLKAYKMLNYILSTIDITKDRSNAKEVISKIKSKIHMISITSDMFFIAKENVDTYNEISKIKKDIYEYQIESEHGHDAFLIEYEQLNTILKKIF